MDTSPTLAASDIQDALVTTETREVTPSLLNVGLRTHPLRFDNNATTVPRPAEEFLVASRNLRHDRETQASVAHYFTDPVSIALAHASTVPNDGSGRIPLPRHHAPTLTLAEAIAARRSVRAFASTPLPLHQLAAVLRYADSETAEVNVGLEDGRSTGLRLRTAPSAGGLYPIEVWIAARTVAGLATGAYRYLPGHDSLETWAQADAVEDLSATCGEVSGEDLVGQAAAVLLLVANPWRSMRKYGPRGLRFVLHEAGSISQNIHLAATATGIGSLDYSGFFDDETHQALGIDGLFRTVVHMVLLGLPA
ncbi:SagB/ThcOx family dehydrogenase [Streptomyces sp. RB6PN25]|uniref:SagB/ThcOx family dehydrogenase n=1 Tax=Streptomyces humicola TaxID=2953240 RepID=A0ABT1PUU3_9ACTN|nr:SagB/ThcOx family dehydrogenase [Streptomyces humicola]MCQ4080755.1 SagB/ThcOx family dehydrogenase [Streptomyces humicola]